MDFVRMSVQNVGEGSNLHIMNTFTGHGYTHETELLSSH